jgi:hypothetical protein
MRHRMSRHTPRRQPSRAELLARLQRAVGTPRRLDRQQVLHLALCHQVNFGLISRGEAGATELWEYVAGVLTWHRVAQLSGPGEPEMARQLEAAARLVDRYGRTGRVLWDGPDLQLAREGIDVMDQLAELVTLDHAMAASDWAIACAQDWLAARGSGIHPDQFEAWRALARQHQQQEITR